ncbi:response regulator, partial [Parabacteroides sp. OttesenSCG-928-K15]|nr:response regulator [Parabacteroides sp. OttesenSCG-928-K15]
MGRFYTFIYTFLFLFSCFPAWGNTDFFFSHLGMENGLSQISVLHIFQDSDGYLWFGTRSGVNKYNGYEFIVYDNEVNNPESLSNGYIQGIAEDKQKNVWIATQYGLNYIDYKTGVVSRHFPMELDSAVTTNAINYFLTTADGQLYAISEKHVLRCNPDNSVELFKLLNEISNHCQSVAQDPVTGDIYMGVNGKGIHIYSSAWEYKGVLKTVNDTTDLATASVRFILNDSDCLWMATYDRGLYHYDKTTNEVTLFNRSNSGLSNNYVRTLVNWQDNSLIIGTFGGLNILRKTEKTISPIAMNIEGQGGLSHYSVHSLLVDRDQTLWVGTYSAGINYYSPYFMPISLITSNEFTGIMGIGKEDKDGNMWFATEGAGLLHFNHRTKEQKLYPLRPLEQRNYERNIIKSIWMEGDSILCATHFGSVYLFSISRKTYTLLYDFKSNDIYSLYVDSKKRLWIPTSNSNNLVMIDHGKQQNRFEVGGTTRSFAYVTLIHEIKPDLLLFGTLNGTLYLYDLQTKELTDIATRMLAFDNYPRLGNISGIIRDSSCFWVSTSNGGLYRLDANLNPIKHYQREDGLSESNISTIILDKNQDLWVATVSELYKLNKEEDFFYPIKPVDLPAQEFSRFAASISSNGTIYFPANKSIFYFDPQKLKRNPTIPQVHFTSFIVNNHEDLLYKIKTDSSVGKKSITLKSNESNIAIRYAALSYIHAEGNQYMYKMEGADIEWHNVGDRREAYYSSLRPGSYTFRLKASNNDGLWNPAESILHITIQPPLYKTWWAYTLYILVILIISLQIYRYQHRKHELERDIRFRQKEQERMKEFHEERMRMYNNFSHELRTPLTLIINPLEDILQNISFSPEIKQALQRMKKNTQRMLGLVNNLMDVQKHEAGDSPLKYEFFDIIPFIEEIYHSFENIAQKRQIEFVLQNELPDSYTVYYDETEIEKVFFNLLSNAFKFTPSRGRVTLLIKQATTEIDPRVHGEEAYIYVEVRDTGKGFTAEEGEKIFEPFYRFQDDLHRQVSGTGIGLSLSRSIVAQHKGYIWAESRENSDTRFMFLLPDTEIQPEHIVREELPPLKEKTQEALSFIEKVEEKQKPVVLVVDDDEDIRQYLQQKLQQEYKIILASNGKEGFDLLQKQTPHLIISDVIMPEMNGIEFCKQVKATPGLSSIPFILLTAKSITSQIEEGFEAGADDYITKPFQLSLLKARIKNRLTAPTVRDRESISDNATILSALGIHIPSEKDEFLFQYIAIVKDNISNPELDVALIYEKLNMSRANFYRKVKSLTTLSPIELIRNIRLEVAKQLLKDSGFNISEIAQKTGFSSRSYFARSFKSVYG